MNLFPGLMQFGYDPDSGTDPTVHLVPTIWIRCLERRIALPVNSAPDFRGMRLGYMVFEATGVMQAGLEAFQLVEMRSERPSGLALSSYRQVFGGFDHRRCSEDFLQGIVAHG